MPPVERAIALYNELQLRAYELTRDQHEAEDLVQATFLRCLEKPPVFVDERSLLRWMRLVMRNLHVDAKRKQRELSEPPARLRALYARG